MTAHATAHATELGKARRRCEDHADGREQSCSSHDDLFLAVRASSRSEVLLLTIVVLGATAAKPPAVSSVFRREELGVVRDGGIPGYDEKRSASRSFLARSTRRPQSIVPTFAGIRVFPFGVAKRTTNMRRRCHALTFLAAILAWPLFARADSIEIRPGDHISIIGNTLADRMQHDGWLETYAPGSFPRAQAGHPQPRLLG